MCNQGLVVKLIRIFGQYIWAIYMGNNLYIYVYIYVYIYIHTYTHTHTFVKYNARRLNGMLKTQLKLSLSDLGETMI